MIPNGNNWEEKNQKVSFIWVNQIKCLNNLGKKKKLILYEHFFNDPQKFSAPWNRHWLLYLPWRQSASSHTNPALSLLRVYLVNRKIIKTSNMVWALLNSSGQGVVVVWALILQGGPKKSLVITQGAASALGYSLALLCHYPSWG